MIAVMEIWTPRISTSCECSPKIRISTPAGTQIPSANTTSETRRSNRRTSAEAMKQTPPISPALTTELITNGSWPHPVEEPMSAGSR